MKNLPFKTQPNPFNSFSTNLELLLSEYRKEPGTNIPDEDSAREEILKALESAKSLVDSGFTGRLAALFPKSWKITQDVRYSTLRRVNKKDYSGNAYIEEEMYTDKNSPAYYGEEMECYASEENLEVIFIIESDEPTHARNPHLFFCKMPYDDFANEKWENGNYKTTQLNEFDNLKIEVEDQDPGKTLVIVHAATHIDLIITDKLLGLPVERQWLGKNRGWARSISRKTAAVIGSCVSNVGVEDDGQADVDGCNGGAFGGRGLVLALTKR